MSDVSSNTFSLDFTLEMLKMVYNNQYQTTNHNNMPHFDCLTRLALNELRDIDHLFSHILFIVLLFVTVVEDVDII